MLLTLWEEALASSRSLKQPFLWRIRAPHSRGLEHEGHSPSTGSRWEGSDLRKCLARQVTWLHMRQDGWKQLSFSVT